MTSSPFSEANSAPSACGLLVVANQMEHTVLVVDPDSRRELAKVVVGVNGHEVVVSKDGRFAYVPIYGNSGVGRPGTDGSTIDVIDLQDHKLAATIDLGKGLRPHRAEFGPDGLLYVTAELANAVDVIDPSTRKVLAEIPTGEPQSHMLVLSRDGRRGYTANVSAGSVSVLDLVKRNLITTIPVAKSGRPVQWKCAGHFSPRFPWQKVSSAFPLHRTACASSPTTRMHPALRSSRRPLTKSRTGSHCRMWRMPRRRLPMGAGCWPSALARINSMSLTCKP